MRYRKTIKIGARIFTPEDIMLLASFLEKQRCQLEGKCSYDAMFSDKTSISSDNIALFTSTYFTRKDVEKLAMEFSGQYVDRSIRIGLENERFFPYVFNEITVDSTDEDWFNSVCNSLTDIVSGIRKRHWIWLLLSPPQFILTFFGYVALSFLFLLGPLGFQWGPKTEDTVVFIHPVAFFLLCLLVFAAIVALAYWLYPPVEFTYPSPRYRRRLQLRKAFGWFFSTLLIPIVLSFLL